MPGRRHDNLEKLKNNELPGSVVFNAIVDYLRNTRSSSQALTINANPDGSGVEFGISKDALEHMLGLSLLMTFRAYMKKEPGTNKMSFNLTPGSVRHPLGVISLAAYKDTAPANGRKYWLACTGRTAGQIASGTDFPQNTATGTTINIPLVSIEGSDLQGWKLTYHHLGDVVLHNMPFAWITGWNSSSAQSLDHDATGQMTWNTYGECE